jgi:Lrp/AsnC family leucine-responsive transcriptional regulator
MTKPKIDEIDLKIVRLLHQDSLSSAKKIAGYLGLHPSTVTYRIRRLQEIGVIKKFTISVDWRKLGMEVEAALLITCSPRNAQKISSALMAMDEVVELHSLTGFSDIIAMVTLTDMNHYKDFIEKRLGNIPEIDSFRAGIVLEDFKEE